MWKLVWLISNRVEGGGTLLCLAVSFHPTQSVGEGSAGLQPGWTMKPLQAGWVWLQTRGSFFFWGAGVSLFLCENYESLIMIMAPLHSQTCLSLSPKTPSFKLQILLTFGADPLLPVPAAPSCVQTKWSMHTKTSTSTITLGSSISFQRLPWLSFILKTLWIHHLSVCRTSRPCWRQWSSVTVGAAGFGLKLSHIYKRSFAWSNPICLLF